MPVQAGESEPQEDLLHGYTGAETFLVGISPTFWAHVPMLIRQVHGLKLIDGALNCLLLHRHGSSPAAPRVVIIPVSKCKLLGTVVCAERKANGCALYVIDDGTGLVDCLHWVTDNDDYDGLPSLTGRSTNSMLLPGAVVQVMGRIQCVAVGDVVETVQVQMDGGGTKACRVNAAVREIHASLLEPVTGASRAMPFSMDCEHQHWKNCVRIQQQMSTPFSASQSGALLNALDVLHVLGPQISAQVADQSNLPASDDTVGAWRLFGTRCTCGNEGIKRDLLYCHCIATADPVDPDFRYRDRLLEKLLQAEQEAVAALPAPPQPKSDEDDEKKKDVDEHTHHLRFQYRIVVADEELNQIAAQQISQRSIASQSNNGQVQHLIRNTFRALRKDGILHLLDAKSDTYLLLSRRAVLEPYIRRSLACTNAAARTRFYAARPAYLDAVPRARLQLVRRSVVLNSNRDCER